MELSSFEQFAILELLSTTDKIKKITDVMEMFIKMFNKNKGYNMAGSTRKTFQCLTSEDVFNMLMEWKIEEQFPINIFS